MQATAEKHANGKATPPPISAIENLDVTLIDPSPTQPRKHFDEKLLKELADNVTTHGVLEPILVRPSPKTKGRFELVFGERRLRATKLAKVKTIPTMVRTLTDAEVLEIQIVENAKRSDLHPLEEADAYNTLHKKHGYAIEEIAAKVAKSTATIYARLKFCTLVHEAREAFFAGKLTAATALMVARIPHEDLQKKAVKEITADNWAHEIPSAREAGRIIQDKFMLRLVDATFDRADAKLVDGVPACTTCPKRTGNQRELFSDIEDKVDLCTDPKCFQSKKDADWLKRAEAAKAKGREVLADKEAKKVFSYGSVKGDSGFVDLKGDTWVGNQSKSNKALLGKADVKITIARDESGNVHELVKASDFKKHAKIEKRSESKTAKAQKRAAERESKAAAAKAAKTNKVVAAIVAKAEKQQPNDAFWRTVALAYAAEFDWDIEDVLERRKVVVEDRKEREDIFRKLIASAKGSVCRGLVVELLINGGLGGDVNRAAFSKLYGVRKK